ncbi:MAG: PilZ domain-containing protein [Deltaproteobacteria bacterium]|nr:PilZ domain-containing protein [Deltaproteobacteria bacterium]MBN2673047.1 PilZ domain-containing protein [Deltaproteobacteria bacterium]
MTHPAETARLHIMQALEACQTDPTLADSLEGLVEYLAKAQKRLFPAVNLPINSPGCVDMVRRAMDALAQSLKILQDLKTNASAVGITAQAIARALQELHPVVQHARKQSARISRPPSERNEIETIDVNTMLSSSSNHQFFNGFSKDIEEGGIFVATFEPKEKGAQVLVHFKLPGNKSISAKGVVHFVREYNPTVPDMAPGMGVKFVNLHPADKTAIEKFLNSRNTMFYEE